MHDAPPMEEESGSINILGPGIRVREEIRGYRDCV